MPARRDSDGMWRYRKVVKLPDGSKERISGTPSRNTKQAAEEAERAHIDRVLASFGQPKKEIIPTFDKWFNDRFWNEWLVARKNKPSEVESKKSIYKHHLTKPFGHLKLDQITDSTIAAFRAKLIGAELSDKGINNVLAVLSKALRYAADIGLIARVPRIGLLKLERPEILWWDYDQYARILESAKQEGAEWYAAVCFAGEAGLRVGELRVVRWAGDVDLVAGTITVNQQMRRGELGTPKGGRRRTVPMTSTLLEAIKKLEVVRTGYVLRRRDGDPFTDGQTDATLRRIIRRAGLVERGWHSLRHSFGTHAAMLGVNPWRLQAWMGHRRIDETMLYVHMAGAHLRPTPPEILCAGETERDPDRRILLMLGARSWLKERPTMLKAAA